MNAKEELIDILKDDKKYIENLFYIKDKSGNRTKLKLNYAQQKVESVIKNQEEQGKPVRIIVLKARQQGISTYIDALGFKRTITEKNRHFAIVTQETSATNNLLERLKYAKNNLPEVLKPAEKNSNAKEIVWENKNKPSNSLSSQISCYTAGGKEIGRSKTIQFLHLSELAFWNETFAKDNYTAITQTVANTPNTAIIIESTANGFNLFRELWYGDNDYEKVFIGWNEEPSYSIQCDNLPNKTEYEIELQEQYNLTDSQLLWRRWCIKNNCSGDVNKFKQEYPITPDEAFISTGTPIFNNNLVINRLNELRKLQEINRPIKGYFNIEYNDPFTRDRILLDKIRFIEDQKGIITIYEKAYSKNFYVLGGDTAGEGADFYAGSVIENYTGKRVATLHTDKIDPVQYVEQMYALGIYYNKALLGVEINFDRYPREELHRLKYPHQYVRHNVDNYNKNTIESFGWLTTKNTRQMIISGEVEIVNNHIDLFYSIPMLEQMLTFVRSKNGRADHLENEHDDLLFADMIAEEIRDQQLRTDDGTHYDTYDISKLPNDYQEDFYKITDEIMKERFIEKMKKIGYL
jgi:hypothetical protein